MKKFALSPLIVSAGPACLARFARLACFARTGPVAGLAVVSLALTAGAGPLDHPSMKEGFWKTHMVTTSNPGNKVVDGHFSVCHSHAFDEWNEARAKQPGCNTTSDSWSGSTRTVSMTCAVHGTTISTTATTRMLSETSVRSESHTTYSPAFMGETEATMTMDNEYAGACPSGVQPGDRVSTDGSIMHLWKH